MRQVARRESAYVGRVTQPAPQSGPSQPAQYAQPAPYAQPTPYAQPAPYAPPPVSRAAAPTGEQRGRTLAIVAIVFAALGALNGPLQAFVTMGLIRSGTGIPVLNIVSPIFAVVGGVLALGALGFGIASLVRRERARALAGAAVGIGAVGLVGLVSAGIQALAYAAL